MPDEPTPAVSVREWTDVVRRARLGKTTKYVALVLATYADYTDGTRIYPGLATVAVAAEVDHKTAKRAVAELLRVGLLEIVKAHSGVRGRGTEYRLIIGETLMDNVPVLSPDQMRDAANRIGRARLRNGGAGYPGPRTPGGQPVDNDGVEGTGTPALDAAAATSADEVRGTPDPPPTEVQGSPRPQYGGPHATRTSTDLDTTHNPHDEADVSTDVTAPGAREARSTAELELEKGEEPPALTLIEGGSEAATTAASLFPAAVPDDRRPTAEGFGFCMACHAAGKTVLAADPIAGSACDFHLRQEAV